MGAVGVMPPGTDDVHALPISLPWPTQPVNAYLVDDDPLTLLDCGPSRSDALDMLEAGLAVHGRRVEDIRRVVLTHQHLDHIGLASEVKRRSGAEVCAHCLLVPWLAEQPSHAERDRTFTAEVMRRGGVPEKLATELLRSERELDGWDPSVVVDRTLADGDELLFEARHWRVLHLPGHSPFDTAFHDEQRGELFSGDHLLPDITSNPTMTVAPNLPADTPFTALASYRASLGRTRGLDLDVVHPGHGTSFRGSVAAVDRSLSAMDSRANSIAAIIEERARTPWEVCLEIWGERATSQPHLTIYEVFGHAADLAAAGRIVQEPDNGLIRLVPSA